MAMKRRLAYAIFCLLPVLPAFASAYTWAGDRIFPATVLLPQIAPSDEAYLTGQSQPVEGDRDSSLSLNFSKTVTEVWRLDSPRGTTGCSKRMPSRSRAGRMSRE